MNFTFCRQIQFMSYSSFNCPNSPRIQQRNIHLNKRTTSIINKENCLKQTMADYLSKQISLDSNS